MIVRLWRYSTRDCATKSEKRDNILLVSDHVYIHRDRPAGFSEPFEDLYRSAAWLDFYSRGNVVCDGSSWPLPLRQLGCLSSALVGRIASLRRPPDGRNPSVYRGNAI